MLFGLRRSARTGCKKIEASRCGGRHFAEDIELGDIMRKKTEDKWDRRYFSLAKRISQWSKDPKAKVGAVLLNRQGWPIALGYNGFPAGVEDKVDKLEDGALKNQMIVHAEQNALLSSGSRARRGSLYVYGKPVCPRCAELLLLIEHDKRKQEYALSLAYSHDRFFVPPNLYLIGLMNTADRSLALVDYALRRRFAFIPLHPMFESTKFHSWLAERAPVSLVDTIVERLKALNHAIEADSALGTGFSIGHSFFCADIQEKALDEEWYRRVIKTEIAPLIHEYWFDNRDQAQALINALNAPL